MIRESYEMGIIQNERDNTRLNTLKKIIYVYKKIHVDQVKISLTIHLKPMFLSLS